MTRTRAEPVGRPKRFQGGHRRSWQGKAGRTRDRDEERRARGGGTSGKQVGERGSGEAGIGGARPASSKPSARGAGQSCAVSRGHPWAPTHHNGQAWRAHGGLPSCPDSASPQAGQRAEPPTNQGSHLSADRPRRCPWRRRWHRHFAHGIQTVQHDEAL